MKTAKQTKGEQYRAILESMGIREYRILAFVFSDQDAPERFHYKIMDPLPVNYYLFDCYDKTAVVIIPPCFEETFVQLAKTLGGQQTMPNLR